MYNSMKYRYIYILSHCYISMCHFLKALSLLNNIRGFIYPTLWRHSKKKRKTWSILNRVKPNRIMHRLHPNWLYTVPTKTTLILLTLLTESRCACNFRPNSGSACPKFFTARSRINFWALIRWFPMFSTNRSLSSGFSTFKDSVVLENHVHRLLFSEQLFFKKLRV